ncbi:MAG: phosphate butyryltransferase [Bacteroidales bacterium]|nr:phosphate butyryltransferase [Bacteroidales bacterium]
MITKLEQIVAEASWMGIQKLSVACPYDTHTLIAVEMARQQGLVEAVLTGNIEKIKRAADEAEIKLSNYDLCDMQNEDAALQTACRKVSVGEADILMKGLVSSEHYLKAVLSRNSGLLCLGNTISHVTVMESPNDDRLIMFGDCAVMPNPDLDKKIQIINSLSSMSRKLGYENPKVAMIAATELITNAISAGQDAAILSKMSDRGQLDCIVDGPLGLDVAIDPEAAAIKNLRGPIQGDANCLVFAEIEAGNAFYKACTKVAKKPVASVLSGTKAPVVMTSRADSVESKFYSIALAILAGTVIN